jgi:hypothetical protein
MRRDLLLDSRLSQFSPSDRPPALRDLGRDFFIGCRLSARFETAAARLTAFRRGRSSAAAFPARSTDHSTNDCANRAGYAPDSLDALCLC